MSSLVIGRVLFLDEIGDLALPLQAKILRAIEAREFERVGSSETIKADVRIIAATNRDLQKAVQEGMFRKDLFYRLNVVNIHLPVLADRRSDIPLLCGHFLEKNNERYSKAIVLEYAHIHCDEEEVKPCHLPGDILKGSDFEDPSGDQSDSSEEARIRAALDQAHWKKKDAALHLGISRATLWRKMKEYGLE